MKIMLQKYQELNLSQPTHLLFRLGADAGFYSEYNNMIFTIYYCLLHNIRFSLSSHGANFCAGGWNEFFEPFCEEINHKLDNYFNNRYRKPLIRGKRIRLKALAYQLHLFHHDIDYLTYDLFHEARSLPLNVVNTISDLDIRGTLVENCRELNKMIYRFNPSTQQEIDKRISSLYLPQDYVAIHVRRGDKKREAEHTSLALYVEKVIANSDCKNVFVATDDYSVFKELEATYLNYHFYTNTPAANRGYEQRAFEHQLEEWRKNELLDLFTTIEIMSKSKLFVGTLSSNIGMYMYWRMPQSKCLGVDFNDWKIW